MFWGRENPPTTTRGSLRRLQDLKNWVPIAQRGLPCIWGAPPHKRERQGVLP